MFSVFLVFLNGLSPATAGLVAMEHNCEKGGTLGVLNTNGVPIMRKPVGDFGSGSGRSNGTPQAGLQEERQRHGAQAERLGRLASLVPVALDGRQAKPKFGSRLALAHALGLAGLH